MAKSKLHRVMIFQPGVSGVVQQLGDTLEAWQAVVGGYIQELKLWPGVSLYCDEDGPAKGLPFNRAFAGKGVDTTKFDFVAVMPSEHQLATGDMPGEWRIYGPFFVARINNGGLVDLTDNDLRKCKKLFP